MSRAMNKGYESTTGTTTSATPVSDNLKYMNLNYHDNSESSGQMKEPEPRRRKPMTSDRTNDRNRFKKPPPSKILPSTIPMKGRVVEDKNKETKLKEKTLVEMGFKPNEIDGWECIVQPPKENLYELLKSMINNHIKPNVQIRIGGVTFNCHMMVLQCYSDFFMECNNEVLIQLPEEKITPGAFMMVYDWMLADEPLVQREGILELFNAATFLRIRNLINQCWLCLDDDVRFREDTAFLLYLEARHYKLEHLEQLMLTRICKFFLTLVSSKEFLDLNASEICTLLGSNTIGVNSEIEIFMSVVRWLSHDWEEREKDMLTVIKCVRFSLMPPWFLVTLNKATDCIEIDRIAIHPEVKRLISDGISYTTTQLYYGENRGEFLHFLERYQLMMPTQRQWVFDKECHYHHRLDCPNMQYITYKSFLEYLEMIQSIGKSYWKSLELAKSQNSMMMPCCARAADARKLVLQAKPPPCKMVRICSRDCGVQVDDNYNADSSGAVKRLQPPSQPQLEIQPQLLPKPQPQSHQQQQQLLQKLQLPRPVAPLPNVRAIKLTKSKTSVNTINNITYNNNNNNVNRYVNNNRRFLETRKHVDLPPDEKTPLLAPQSQQLEKQKQQHQFQHQQLQKLQQLRKQQLQQQQKQQQEQMKLIKPMSSKQQQPNASVPEAELAVAPERVVPKTELAMKTIKKEEEQNKGLSNYANKSELQQSKVSSPTPPITQTSISPVRLHKNDKDTDGHESGEPNSDSDDGVVKVAKLPLKRSKSKCSLNEWRRMKGSKLLVFGGVDPYCQHCMPPATDSAVKTSLQQQQKPCNDSSSITSSDNEVLRPMNAAGGGGTVDGSVGDQVIMYDGKAARWRQLSRIPFGSRHHHVAVLCQGLIYIVGGTRAMLGCTKNSIFQRSVWSFDPRTLKWTVECTLPEARRDFAVMAIDDRFERCPAAASRRGSGKGGGGLGTGLLVIGGEGAHGVALNSVWFYDILRKQWTKKASLNVGRYGFAATMVNREIWIAGGIVSSSVASVGGGDGVGEDSSDCGARSTADIITDSMEYYSLRCMKIGGDRGGGDGDNGVYGNAGGGLCGYCDMAEVGGGRWVRSKLRLRVPRLFGKFCLISPTELYIVGGISFRSANSPNSGSDMETIATAAKDTSLTSLTTVDRFDFTTAKWVLYGNINVARHGHDAVAYDGCLAVIGGVSTTRKCTLAQVELFSPRAQNLVQELPALPWPLSGISAVVIE